MMLVLKWTFLTFYSESTVCQEFLKNKKSKVSLNIKDLSYV